MRRLFLFLFLLSSMLAIHANTDGIVKVKLKNGTTIKGELKKFDPLKEIVLVMAGIETKISMSEVENVEMSEEASATANQPEGTVQQATPVATLGKEKLIVTETTPYPAKKTIVVGNKAIDMILVPGGKMNMGYDGKGSLSMKSEPIHEVGVTSFYISSQPLPAYFVTNIVGTKQVKGQGNEPAEVLKYSEVEKLIASLNKQASYKLRLPTEAEWEYAASSEQQNENFSIARGEKTAYEWCSDLWGEFNTSDNGSIDPIGPSRGKEHVIRAYNGKHGKFDRSNDVSGKRYQGLVRLAIKANEL